jgi:hypothetical protein
VVVVVTNNRHIVRTDSPGFEKYKITCFYYDLTPIGGILQDLDICEIPYIRTLLPTYTGSEISKHSLFHGRSNPVSLGVFLFVCNTVETNKLYNNQ